MSERVSVDTTESPLVFAPLWRDEDGNELYLLGDPYCSTDKRTAQEIALGMRLVEAVLLHLTFVEVREVNQRNLPHIKATIAGSRIAVVGGPTFNRVVAGHTAPECDKCENGVIESLVPGSASKTEHSFCSCSAGQALKAENDDALEAKGEERAR